MSTSAPRVQLPLPQPTLLLAPSAAPGPIRLNSGQLLGAVSRALSEKVRGDYAVSDAMVRLLLDEPLLTPEHLFRLTHTLVGRIDAGLEPARIALCAHPLIGDTAFLYALAAAPTSSLRAVAAATSRLIPNALDWESRAYFRREGHRFQPLGGLPQRRIAALVARWEARTAGDAPLRSFICSASFLFTDQRAMFAAGRSITVAPGRYR